MSLKVPKAPAADSTLLADPSTYVDGVPYGEFARRRRDAPVSWVDEPRLVRHSSDAGQQIRRGRGFWAVTRHDAVFAASLQPKVFSSGERGAFIADPQTAEDLERARQLLTNMDDPAHARIRRLVSTAFTPRSVAMLRAGIEKHARRLVDKAVAMAEFDAVGDFAAELPLLVLSDLLGIPHADRGLLYQWSNHLVGFDDPEFGASDIDLYRQTFTQAFHYARELRKASTRRSVPDLIARLARGEVDGEKLSDGAFCNLFLLLVIAGNETTRHLISGGLQRLAEAPAERDRLLRDPGMVNTATDELIRHITPIMQFRRTAMVDTELDGQAIAAGDKVVLYYVSANRDERVFAEADRLDLGRRPNPHLSFGVGPHFCLGAHLARSEMQAVLTALLPYLSRWEPTGPVVRLASNFMNGIKTMPVRIRPPAPASSSAGG